MDDKQRREIRGKYAERQVFRILRELDEDCYAVFNDVEARYGNIDHVVVSRAGAVFLVETKSHRGKVTYDGKQLLLNGRPFEKDFIAQINRNIVWLRERIKEAAGTNVWIVSVLVFTNAIMYSEKGKPVLRLRPVNRINVINSRYLKPLIKSYSPRQPRPAIWRNCEDLFQ